MHRLASSLTVTMRFILYGTSAKYTAELTKILINP